MKNQQQHELTPETKELVQAFARQLAEDGKRPKTIESYVGDVTLFLAYLARMGTGFAGDLRRFHVTGYRNRLVERGYEASTINKKLNSLQSFNCWLVGRGLAAETVVDLRKDRVRVASGSEKQVEVYDERQLERLLFFVQSEKVSARDRAVVLTLLYTGVRVSELCDVKVKNIDFLTSHLKVVGKGGKVREVPLKPEVAEAIRDYLIVRTGVGTHLPSGCSSASAAHCSGTPSALLASLARGLTLIGFDRLFL